MSTWSSTGVDRWLGSNIMQHKGMCGPWCPVPELHHTSVPLDDSGQAPGGL